MTERLEDVISSDIIAPRFPPSDERAATPAAQSFDNGHLRSCDVTETIAKPCCSSPASCPIALIYFDYGLCIGRAAGADSCCIDPRLSVSVRLVSFTLAAGSFQQGFAMVSFPADIGEVLRG